MVCSTPSSSLLVNRRRVIQTLAASTTLAMPAFIRAQSSAPIKVGVLHSQSGTLANSETLLKETALMVLDDLNRKGGVLGRKLEAVVADPASEASRFASMAQQMLVQEKVAVIFGGWASSTRKAMLPVLTQHNGLLFYAVQYEGQEQHPNVFYTGSVPNQQALPAIDHLLSPAGGSRQRFLLVGTDYIYPRTTNAILHAYLKSKGVADADIVTVYRPFSHVQFNDVMAQAQQMAKGKPTAIVSTINGDSNNGFYAALANARISAQEIPSVAFSVSEEELRDIDTAPLVGHMAAWNYFMSSRNAMNRDFIKRWAAYAQEKKIPKQRTKPLVNDPMQSTLVGMHMWKQAVEKAQTEAVAPVIAAMNGQLFPAPSGDLMRMDAQNHHLYKTPMVGAMRADGQFDVVWSASQAVRAQPWSPLIPR